MSAYFPLSPMQQLEEFVDFHLTGSRFLEVEHEHSDTDFMVQLEEDNHKFQEFKTLLVKLNFENITHTYAGHIDPSHICEVWRSPCSKYDIQIVPDISHKLRAQEYIRILLDNGFKYPVTKSERKKVWQYAMNRTKQ